MEDWYRIKTNDFLEMGGDSLLENYGWSYIRALTELYPQYNWRVWKFDKVPNDFWKEESNSRKFLEHVARELNLNPDSADDWYKVTRSDIERFKGQKLLREHGKYPCVLIPKLLPSLKFKTWKFQELPMGFWSDEVVQREFLEDLGEKLHLKNLDDWYSITSSDIAKHGGEVLLSIYKYSPAKLISSVFKEHNWKIWRFSGQNHVKCREYLTSLEGPLQIQSFEDWYKIKQADVLELGGASVLAYYGNSLIAALLAAFPEHPWQFWKFERMPKGTWDQEANIHTVIEWASKQLQIEKLDDWYTVTKTHIRALGLSSLTYKYGGLIPLLSKVYPNHNWNTKHKVLPSKNQFYLYKSVEDLLPKTDIHIDFLHPKLYHESSKRVLELDVYVPEYNIAFEYQGEQHFASNVHFQVTKEVIERDQFKREACKKAGITLIEIPYWWDLSKESLAATIRKHCPKVKLQISDNSAPPIPEKIEMNK